MKIKRFKKRLDQDTLLKNLSLPVEPTPDGAHLLHWTLAYALIDAFDQGITREAFANLVIAALAIKSAAAGAGTLRMVRERVDAGIFSPELIQTSIDGNIDIANEYRAEMAQQYALVTECRSEGEPVH